MIKIASLLALLAVPAAQASIAYGTLNNFDCVNDTGVEAHGFDIELQDVRSTDITYTYDYNHYGVPKITEDNSDPLHPRTLVRYASARNSDGTWSAYTAVPSGPIAPTQGHDFTNPSINFGGEHFGVGYYGAPTAVRYNWLIDDGAGNLVHGPAVNVSTPTFVYNPPALAAPANVVAVIVPPPPPPAEPQVYRFGEASWVKSIKTTTHNSHEVELIDLVSDDPGQPQPWANGEPDEVEVEWRLLQTEFANPNNPKGELQGAPEELPGGDEVVTRRYEFYKYTGPFDAESGEAMADAVAADDLHGVGSVTFNGSIDPLTGEWVEKTVELSQVIVVGEFFGAQMSGFDAAPGLGLIDNLQEGELNIPYTPRTIVVGGTPPVVTSIAEELPPGLVFDPIAGVLSGTPTGVGTFTLTVHSTDQAGGDLTKAYTLRVLGDGGPAIVPDQAALPEVTGECVVTVTAAPTANGGVIVGITTDPLSFSAPGDYVITWHYSDGAGNVSSQTQAIKVTDSAAPVPDLPVLPDIIEQCSVTALQSPAATDFCAGSIAGTTTDPLTYGVPGDYLVTWVFDDGNGNVSSQSQWVRVHDTLAPVPTLPALPNIIGVGSVTVNDAPTASDNCSGLLIGTTTDPLTYTSPGTYTILWAFTDASGNSATQTQSVQVNAPLKVTVLTSTTETSAKEGAHIRFEVKLQTSTGSGLGGESIEFLLGTQHATGVTNSKGIATGRLVLDQPPGSYSMQASFAGTAVYAPSDVTGLFVITPKHK